MRTIALHGDFASGAILRRDTGIESWEYPNWKRDRTVPIPREPYCLVGYSSGGSRIGHLSIETVFQPVCAVLYESPLLGRDDVGDTFPVLWIRNDRGRGRAGLFKRRHEREMASTLAAWKAGGRYVEELDGTGRHFETTNDWPPLRHGWDRALNERILSWIEEMTQ